MRQLDNVAAISKCPEAVCSCVDGVDESVRHTDPSKEISSGHDYGITTRAPVDPVKSETQPETRSIGHSGNKARGLRAAVLIRFELGMSQDTPAFLHYRGKKPPRFATPTELQAARILDYYCIPWDYEPRTFILEKDGAGNIVEAFTPDFYLPELDLYLEVTQMKQSLVTAKHRKVRKLREMHPEINIKIFHKRDFVQLAKKYNIAPPE